MLVLQQRHTTRSQAITTSFEATTRDGGSISFQFYDSQHGPVVAVGGVDYSLPELARYAAQALIQSMGNLRDSGELERILAKINTGGEAGEARVSCHHQPTRFDFTSNSQEVVVGQHHFQPREFAHVAAWLLGGGDFGYSIIHPEVLAAREAVLKVGYDQKLWELLEQSGQRLLALICIADTVVDPVRAGADMIQRGNRKLFQEPLQGYLLENYFQRS